MKTFCALISTLSFRRSDLDPKSQVAPSLFLNAVKMQNAFECTTSRNNYENEKQFQCNQVVVISGHTEQQFVCLSFVLSQENTLFASDLATQVFFFFFFFFGNSS